MKRIVLGYDDSEPSQRALERAAELAGAFQSELIVTSVVPLFAGVARTAGPIDPVDTPERHLEELAHARTYLDGRGLQAEYVRAVGEPSDTIVELAAERQADMIVIGTRELGAFKRMLGQSVSESVLHHAPCDVLIVR